MTTPKLDIPLNIDQLMENERRYRQLVQGMPEAIYVCDEKGYLTYYNKAAESLWGRTPEIGKDRWCGAWKVYAADGQTPLPLEKCPMAFRLKGKKVKPGTNIVVERPDGTRRNVAVYPEVIYDDAGQIAGAFSMLLDVTTQKRAEYVLREGKEQYRKLAATLEKRVQRRTKALHKANDFLERSNKELEQFAFVTSHDLQEPLRKIQTFGDILHDQYMDSMNEKGRAYVEKIVSSSRRLSLMINSLLRFSILNQPGANLEEVDLNSVLRGVLDDFELLIKQKNARLRVGKLPRMNGDSLQIGQLFSNLIGNSLKFSRTEEPPAVEIRARKLPAKERALHPYLEPGLNYFEVSVKDNGIGFDQRYAEKVFNVFQRLNDKYQYEGTGIGLTICAKVVANHKGHIYVRSEVNKGASFYVLLPFNLESL